MDKQGIDQLGIQQAQFQKLKYDIMQTWCVFLFNSEHRCVLNHICNQSLQARQVTLKTLSEFKNSLNIVAQLKQGFLVTVTEVKSDRQKISYVKINNQFFKHLPDLIEMVKNKINPEVQKIKQFNPQEKKKICTVCKVEKTQSEINFMGPKCQCATPHFVDIKQDPEKKARFDQLERLLSEIIKKKKKYDQLQIQIIKKRKERSQMKEKKTGDLQKFLQKEGIPYQSNKTKQVKNYETMMLAMKMFSPYREYKKINELERIRQQRKKTESK